MEMIVCSQVHFSYMTGAGAVEVLRGVNLQVEQGTHVSIVGPSGAGIDIDELIRVFQFKKNKSMEKFRERLEEQEHAHHGLLLGSRNRRDEKSGAQRRHEEHQRAGAEEQKAAAQRYVE